MNVIDREKVSLKVKRILGGDIFKGPASSVGQLGYTIVGGNSEVFDRGEGKIVVLTGRDVYNKNGLYVQSLDSAFAVGGTYLEPKDVDGRKLPTNCTYFSVGYDKRRTSIRG